MIRAPRNDRRPAGHGELRPAWARRSIAGVVTTRRPPSRLRLPTCPSFE